MRPAGDRLGTLPVPIWAVVLGLIIVMVFVERSVAAYFGVGLLDRALPSSLAFGTAV